MTRVEPLRTLCLQAAESSGMTIVGDSFHQFEPAGVTGTVLLAESLASSLAARLVQNRISRSHAQAVSLIAQEGLDRRRLSRVLDYIEANLEGDLSLDHLASIACLSRFHFARAFKAAVGHPPHQYVSAKRFERGLGLSEFHGYSGKLGRHGAVLHVAIERRVEPREFDVSIAGRERDPGHPVL